MLSVSNRVRVGICTDSPPSLVICSQPPVGISFFTLSGLCKLRFTITFSRSCVDSA